MTILILTIAIALAAFCVWLTVRIIHRRERWAKWMAGATLFAVFVVYPASLGPWFWLDSTWRIPKSFVWTNEVYAPLRYLCRSSETVNKAFVWYLSFWVPEHLPEYHGE